MTSTPSYVIHHVNEKDFTVDWFFGRGRPGRKAAQAALIVIGWFFAILPIVITASAIRNRNDDEAGWWSYSEGFAMWDLTIAVLGILTAFFVLGFLALHLVDRVAATKAARGKTYDERRLDQRIRIADAWYAEKFGPEELRLRQARIQIEPYADIETYELRGRYRGHGVE